MDIKIRSLTIWDQRLLASMIKKVGEKAGNDQLLNIMVKGTANKNEEKASDDSTYITILIKVLDLLLSTLESDVTPWLANLLGVSPEEYMRLPFDTDVKVIQQIIDAPEITSFFSGAWHLSKKIPGLIKK